jgi:isocitrate lyase
VKAKFPDKLLAYNCSPSFNWKKKLDAPRSRSFSASSARWATNSSSSRSPGFHALNYSMFRLAHGYKDRGMAAYSELQEAEFAAEADGYTATKHQREVGTGYFDEVAQVIAGGKSSTTALRGSTEQEQFH